MKATLFSWRHVFLQPSMQNVNIIFPLLRFYPFSVRIFPASGWEKSEQRGCELPPSHNGRRGGQPIQFEGIPAQRGG